MRSKTAIQQQIGEASVFIVKNTTDVSGMTYEEGVDAALRWVLEETNDLPIE